MAWKTKRNFKWGLLVFFTAWVIFAQSCMKFRMSDSAAKAGFEQRGLPAQFITVKEDGVPLHYVKCGSDGLPTLFFVHGSPGSWDAFRIYMMDTALLKHFRLISVDRPGFGYSDFGTAYHLSYQASLINKIIEKENNNEPVHLIGHSIGGPVIVRMAQDKPQYFSSLTILSGSVSPYDEPKEYWRYAFAYSPLKFLMPGAFRPSNDEIVYFKKELYKLDEGYGLLRMPVTFIHGDKDKFVTVKNVDYGKSKLEHNPGVKIILIPGAGHFIPWERFDIIRDHLLTLKSN
ncbi:MAG: alpha/beta hydrolase [Ferruginibacter sp.]|nr:alpha/beta hydrolase [Ferruginibacter sp.]